jgi:hypothetical protein
MLHWALIPTLLPGTRQTHNKGLLFSFVSCVPGPESRSVFPSPIESLFPSHNIPRPSAHRKRVDDTRGDGVPYGCNKACECPLLMGFGVALTLPGGGGGDLNLVCDCQSVCPFRPPLPAP